MINRFSIPAWVNAHDFYYAGWKSVPEKQLLKMREGLARFRTDCPLVSVVIPVWNEEEHILRTLSSFASMHLPVPTELIFVNNNSTDATRYILEFMNVKTVFEPRQGIAHARLAGLRASKGVFQLCGDGDSLYPPTWITAMVEPLMLNPRLACVYGNYSFLPTTSAGRLQLGAYELVAETLFEFRRLKREFLNVRGANFGFRTAQGLAAKGFEMGITRVYDNDEKSKSFVVFGEDGRMGRKLSEVGSLKLIRSPKARIWTSSRRLVKDGSLLQAFTKRLARESARLFDYAFGRRKVQHTTDNLSQS